MKLPQTMMALAMISCVAVGQATILVPQQQPTIQDALIAAQPGDLILVDPGVYAGPVDFLGKDVVLRSVAGAAQTSIENLSASSLPMLSFVNGETMQARIEGFTVRGGRSGSSGAGIRVVGATPVISDWIIDDNETLDGTPAINAANGAGVFVTAGGSPRFERCRISDNRTGIPSPCAPGVPCIAVSSNGGGVALFFAAASFVDCEILRNESQMSGGGIWVGPGAFLSMNRCLIADNECLAGPAGGIEVEGRADIRRSTLTRNTAPQASGLRALGPDTKLIGCFVVDHPGANVNVIEGQNLEIAHCTIANNDARLGGVMSSTIVDSILWNKPGLDELAGVTGSPTVSHCVLRVSIFPGYLLSYFSFTVPSSINFVDAANGDYHLLPTSPAIGAAGFGSLSASDFDIDGEPRLMGSQFDAGADEAGCGGIMRLSDPSSPHGVSILRLGPSAWRCPRCWHSRVDGSPSLGSGSLARRLQHRQPDIERGSPSRRGHRGRRRACRPHQPRCLRWISAALVARSAGARRPAHLRSGLRCPRRGRPVLERARDRVL